MQFIINTMESKLSQDFGSFFAWAGMLASALIICLLFATLMVITARSKNSTMINEPGAQVSEEVEIEDQATTEPATDEAQEREQQIAYYKEILRATDCPDERKIISEYIKTI